MKITKSGFRFGRFMLDISYRHRTIFWATGYHEYYIRLGIPPKATKHNTGSSP